MISITDERWVVLAALLLVSGCYGTTPEIEAAKYRRAPVAYSKLITNAHVDLGKRKCLVVGADNIESGFDRANWPSFWKNGDGSWYEAKDHETKLTLAQVLAANGLSNVRYTEYMSLLHQAGGERLTYCENDELGTSGQVLVYRSGLAISGCSAIMHWTSDPLTPIDTSEAGRSTVIDAGDGWRLVYECT